MRASMSDINSFLQCRLQWQWGSVQNLMPVDSFNVPFAIGTGVHRALEQWYRPLEPDDTDTHDHSLVSAFTDWYGAQCRDESFVLWDSASLELVSGMLHGYAGQYGPLPFDDPHILRMLSTEQEFEVNIPGRAQHQLIGTIDGMFLDYHNDLWLVDHKTYGYAPTLQSLQRNQQFLGYTWAANQLLKSGALRDRFGLGHTRVEGVLYNGIRKKLPTARTTAPFFKREWLRYSDYELAFFERHLRQVVDEMNKPDRMDYYAPGLHCDRCAFSEPCSARQLGEDYTWALKTYFQRKPPRGTVYRRDTDEDEHVS